MNSPQFESQFLRQHWPQVLDISARILNIDECFADFCAAHPELPSAFRQWSDLLYEMYFHEGGFAANAGAWVLAIQQVLGAETSQRWLTLAAFDFALLKKNHPAYAHAQSSGSDFNESLADRQLVLIEASDQLLHYTIRQLEDHDLPSPLHPQHAFNQLAHNLAGLPVSVPQYGGQAWDTYAELARQMLNGVLQFDHDGLWQSLSGSHSRPLKLPHQPYPDQRVLQCNVRRLLVHAVISAWQPCDAIQRFCQQQPQYAPFELLSWWQADWPAGYLPLRATLYELLLSDPQAYQQRGEMEDVIPAIDPHAFAGSKSYMSVARWLNERLMQQADYLDTELGQSEFYRRRFLLQCSGLEQDEDREALASQLASYLPAVMSLLLAAIQAEGYAMEEVLLLACDKKHLLGPCQLLKQHAFNTASDEPGRESIEALKTQLHALNAEDWLWLCSHHLDKDSVKLLAALRGDNAKAIEKSAISKHAHIAIKALGLLPLPSDDAHFKACLQRYLQYKTLAQQASQYGAERCANHRAAVQVGLANLAVNAGYASLGELEWQMESLLGESLQPWFSCRQIGDYSVQIVLQAANSGIVVTNAKGKILSAPPAAIKKDPEWLALKDAWATLNDQRQRFRAVLDEHLVKQTTFSDQQLAITRQHPLLYALISKLVWVDEAGYCGLYQLGQLSGLHGFYDISGHVRLAHPVEWLQDGTLSAWQERAVALGLIQPIQQIFRALYIPTPAEVEAKTISQRYANRWIRTRTAAGIFKARGWQSNIWPRDEAEHGRRFAHGYSAHINFDFNYHYFTEVDTLRTTEASFRQEGEDVDLSEVPAIIFSEAMRDLDLMIARSIINETEQFTSGETVAARHALLQALRPALGNERLRLEDRHAIVTGKLAHYRINLASAHIHIEPGSYLCIIPDYAKIQAPIRLPFEDADERSNEIISKIVLLLDDDKIKDESIMSQIRMALNRH